MGKDYHTRFSTRTGLYYTWGALGSLQNWQGQSEVAQTHSLSSVSRPVPLHQ